MRPNEAILMQNGVQSLIEQIRRKPVDFYIGGHEDPYIRRWWLTEREPDTLKTYLHNQQRDDEDRAMHDHPSDNISIIIEGGYIEHTPYGVFYRKPGDVIFRKAADLHRLELYRTETGKIIESWSIFTMGPKVRDWGFMCPEKGWVPWQVFCDTSDHGKVGRGCE